MPDRSSGQPVLRHARTSISAWMLLSVAVLLVLGACRATRSSAHVPGYRTVADIPLPGDTSRWDYQVYDPASRRLYLAHLGESQIVVFDTARQKVVGVVKDIAGVHGLALAPDLGRLFASATDDNRVVAIDLGTLRVVGSAPTGDYPDGIAYVPGAAVVFVSNERGSGDTVVDARTSLRLGRVQLGGDIGNSQYDPASKLVYVAVGSTNDLVGIDSVSRTVVARYHLDGCLGAHGVQIDESASQVDPVGRRRVFVACEGNARLVVFDLVAGRATQQFDVGEGPDVLAEDPVDHRLYVAAESGDLAVFDTAGGAIVQVGRGRGGPGAHTVAVDTTTHLVYLALADIDGRPVLRELQSS